MRSAQRTSTFLRWKSRYSAITRGPKKRVSLQWNVKNSIRTSSERFVLWLQNRQREHYGPQAYIPELFQRRDLPFFALQTGHWRTIVPPPRQHHDLIDAAAKVGALEQRLGYTFKNRATCIEALKTTGDHFPIYHDGVIYDYTRNNRLALLGDRVLSLVVCQIWFETKHSTKDHSTMSMDTVSRNALAVNALDLGLQKSVLTDPSSRAHMNKDTLAETFEAVMGAVYVDSSYDVNTVTSLARRLRLDDHRFLKTGEEAVEEGEDQVTNKQTPQQITSSEHLLEDAAVKSDSATQLPHSQAPEKITGVHSSHVEGVIEDESPSKPGMHPQSNYIQKSIEGQELKARLDIEKITVRTKDKRNMVSIAATKTLRTCKVLMQQGQHVKPFEIFQQIYEALKMAHNLAMQTADEEVRQAKAAAESRSGQNHLKEALLKAAIRRRRSLVGGLEERQIQKIAKEQVKSIISADKIPPTAEESVHETNVDKLEEEEKKATTVFPSSRRIEFGEPEGKASREAEEKARKEAEDNDRKRKEAQKEVEAEAKARKEAKAKAQREAEAEAKARKEAKAKAQREAEAEAKARKEAKAKAQREAEAEVKARKEAKYKARMESEAKLVQEAEAVKATHRAEAFEEGLSQAEGSPKKMELEGEACAIEIEEEQVLGSLAIKEENTAEAPAVKSTSQKEKAPREPVHVTLLASKQSVEELENDISESHSEAWASASDLDTTGPQISNVAMSDSQDMSNSAVSGDYVSKASNNLARPQSSESARYVMHKPCWTPLAVSAIVSRHGRIAQAIALRTKALRVLESSIRRRGRRTRRRRLNQAVPTAQTSEKQHSSLAEKTPVTEQENPSEPEESGTPEASTPDDEQMRLWKHTPSAEQAHAQEKESQTAQPEAPSSSTGTLEETLLQERGAHDEPHTSPLPVLPTLDYTSASEHSGLRPLSFAALPIAAQPVAAAPIMGPRVRKFLRSGLTPTPGILIRRI